MTASLQVVVADDDPTPPYEQVRSQIADLVTTGALAPGERLPPLRQLAADLGLAVGTVGRAYRELESAGLVASRRGGGTRVAQDGASTGRAPSEPAGSRLEALARQLVSRARGLGADDAAVLTAVQEALAAPPPRGGEASGPEEAAGRTAALTRSPVGR